MASTASSLTGPTSRASCSKRAASAGARHALQRQAAAQGHEVVAAVPGRRYPRAEFLGRLPRRGRRIEAGPPQSQRGRHAVRRQPVLHDRSLLCHHAHAQPGRPLPRLGQVRFHRVRGAGPWHGARALRAHRRADRRDPRPGRGWRKSAARVPGGSTPQQRRHAGRAGAQDALRAAQAPAQTSGMSWPYPRIVAHRGGGALAPENTLGAIRLGAAMGFKGVEFDVMLASDGTPVVIHDETVDRTTDGKGEVSKMSYAELSGFSINKTEKIPRYEDVVRLCRELGIWANVEIKPAKGYELATGDAVARMTRELWKDAPVAPLLSSFSPVALAAAQEAAPELPRGGLCDA